MDKATRWLKSIFGLKTNKNHKDSHHHNMSAGLCHNPSTIPRNITAGEAAWLQSLYTQSEKEQSKHAIVVAAATAAAADAAVAAAHAAAAVVRLTSHGRGTLFPGEREKWAAVKIQSSFRAYLARKARRALKGLVKLQALVRGYLVRKQAAATLNGMQALIRAQAAVIRAKRAVRGITVEAGNRAAAALSHSQSRAIHRQSMDKFDDKGSEDSASIYSRRLMSTSFDNRVAGNPIIDEVPKVLEIDTGRLRISRFRRRKKTGSSSECGDQPSSYLQSHPCSLQRHLDLVPRKCKCKPSSSQQPHLYYHEWGWTDSDCRFSTAQSTPRFNSSDSFRNNNNPSLTPAAKSVCSDSLLTNYNHPNYMASTQSYMAKLRSQSAPRQRPDSPGGGGTRQRNIEVMMEEPRSSMSGTWMQRSCSQAQEAINFKNTVMGKFDKSSEFERRYSYAPRH